GVSEPGPRDVIRKVAAELNAPLTERDRDFRYTYSCSHAAQRSGQVQIVTPRCHYPPLPLGLPGEHQAANAAVALSALERLRDTGMPVSDSAVQVGLRHIRWPARIELVSERPVVTLDTAHNVPSAEALVRTLRESFPVPGRKAVVLAVSSDKQYPEMLRLLAGSFDHFPLTKYGNNPRCVPPERLAGVLAELAPGKPFTLHPTAAGAWSAARSAAGPDDLVCVTGSVFLAGELRPLLVEGGG